MTPRQFIRARARANPRFIPAIVADARAVAATLHGAEASKSNAFLLVFRMIWEADAYLALLLIRAAARMRAHGIPILPLVCRRLAIVTAQVHIGAPVILEPGIILPHGQVVIDGLTEVGSGAIIRPFVTIGLRDGDYQGPTIGKNVRIGTGAKIIGPIKVANRSAIRANAVVAKDFQPQKAH